MKHFSIESLSFDEKVDLSVMQCISRGASEFTDILASMPGVYPTAALGSIRRLAKRGHINASNAAKLVKQAKHQPRQSTSYNVLPPPHPLNYEWRFDKDTSRSLLMRAFGVCASSSDCTLLLGTPTLALAAMDMNIAGHATFLGEKNAITSSISQMSRVRNQALETIDSLSQSSVREFRSVVLDPPWYDECILEMLPLAAKACTQGGHVFLVAAPLGARRSSITHRKSLLQLAHRCGLSLVSEAQSFARYQTPFFEANALKAAGLALPGDWRSADLLAFKKSVVWQHDVPSPVPVERAWVEVGIGRMRVFVDLSRYDAPCQTIQLQSIIPGDVLPTVSRRDARRAKANVWTSGNRVFRCNRPHELVAALQGDFLSCLGDDRSDPCRHSSVAKFQHYAKLKCYLESLSAIERGEERQHFGDGFGPQRTNIRRARRAVAEPLFLGATPVRDPSWRKTC